MTRDFFAAKLDSRHTFTIQVTTVLTTVLGTGQPDI